MVAGSLRSLAGISGTRPQELPIADLLGPLTRWEEKFAPPTLHVAGQPDLIRSGRRVAIVGSRKATSNALRRTRKLARALVRHEVTVVSGLAEGVDTAAHRTAIESGGRTIAVLGTPLNVAYPPRNRNLQRLIGDEHLLVSQFRAGSPVRKSNFPTRNRTMALISDATVIVHAGPKSGTRYQGWEAVRLGRDLMLLESLAKIGLPWTKALRHYGAEVLSDANLERWLAQLPPRVVLTEDDFDLD